MSFSAAARALGIDQATLSRQIRQLEKDVGFALFQRTTRTVTLTEEGATLVPEAEALSAAWEAAQARIRLLRRENDARLRFGMHPFVYWSPEIRALLEAFCGEGRGAVETSSGTSMRSLGKLDLGLLDAAPALKSLLPDTYETIPALRVTPHLVLPAEHPVAAESIISEEMMRSIRIATFRPSRDRQDFDAVFGPVLANSADIMVVSEGAAAVVFHAVADRLAMISLRPHESPAPDGFVRRPLAQAQPADFVLTRTQRDDRGTINRFWNLAQRMFELRRPA